MVSTPLVTLYQNPRTQTRYLQGTLGNLPCTFELTEWDMVKRVAPPEETLQKIAQYILEDFFQPKPPEMLVFLKDAIESHIKACKAIGEKLGWAPEGEGLECMNRFTDWLKEKKVETWESLDLSNLKLTCLPPQIGLFSSLKTLNLKGNSLFVFPPELKARKIEVIEDYACPERDEFQLAHPSLCDVYD